MSRNVVQANDSEFAVELSDSETRQVRQNHAFDATRIIQDRPEHEGISREGTLYPTAAIQ